MRYRVEGEWNGRPFLVETNDRQLAEGLAGFWGFPVVVVS